MEDLITVVFPALDRFFSFLGLLASMPFSAAVSFLMAQNPLTYVEITGFTGNIFTFYTPHLGGPLSSILEYFLNGVGSAFGVTELPFVFALLIILCVSFLGLLVIRFLISVISGIVS